MKILLMNTCGAEGIVALVVDGAVVREERLPGRGTSEHLMPAVRRVLGEVRVRELAALGVVLGPGSFTGMRVGLAAAKGLCEAGTVRMVGMSRLELLAGAGAMAVLDAGRGEFYYRAGGVERIVGADAVGLGAVTCEARVAEALGDQVTLVEEPGAALMLAFVRRRVEAAEWTDVASVDANYLRRTDAEVKKDEGKGNA